MILDPSGERDRLEREVRVHKRLRELLLLFSRGISSSLGLNAALETLTPEIRDILGAGHGRNLAPRPPQPAAGPVGAPPRGSRSGPGSSIDDTSHYAAAGLRLDRPKLRGTRVDRPAPRLAPRARHAGHRSRQGAPPKGVTLRRRPSSSSSRASCRGSSRSGSRTSSCSTTSCASAGCSRTRSTRSSISSPSWTRSSASSRPTRRSRRASG